MRPVHVRALAGLVGLVGAALLMARGATEVGPFEFDDIVGAGLVGAAVVVLAAAPDRRGLVAALPPLVVLVAAVVLLRTDEAARRPEAATGAALLFAAAVVIVALKRPEAAAVAAPGAVVSLAALLDGTDGWTAVLVAAGAVAVGSAGTRAWVRARRRRFRWTPGAACAAVLGGWLLLAPATWGWVRPVHLDAYQEGVAVAGAAAGVVVAALAALRIRTPRW